ncbi:MAG: DUF2075 domain-containing protein, partial [Gammaproteobacteria bacterium]|nr:DUF2075 domain-containing protein [Gammaproteobacteria bacterium]
SLESALRDKVAKGFSARFLSSYSVPWKTRSMQDPHRVSPGDRDFIFASGAEQETKPWSKVWNVVPDRDNYAPFVQGAPGSGICEDPLAEVGCPYVVRGFDFDYIGLLWLKDLVWSTEENRWSINTSEVFESGLSRLIGRAKRGDADAQRELLRKVCQAYRILLTRPLRGVYVWVLDADTRAYISRCVAG